MKENTFDVRLTNGKIGKLKTFMKARELIGRPCLIKVDNDGFGYYVSGIVEHVYEQCELEL